MVMQNMLIIGMLITRCVLIVRTGPYTKVLPVGFFKVPDNFNLILTV